MSENYKIELCEERHKRTDERIETHDRRLNDHSGRIDKLEQRGASVDAKIENLCEQLKSLTATLKWFIGLLVGSFVAFFFYAVEKGLFK